MVRTPLALALLCTLAACGKNSQDSGLPINLDIRIDRAPQESDPDSHSTKMCVNEDGQIFVVWVDNRDGSDDVWFNRSENLGVDWLPAAVKLNRGLNNNVWAPAIGCNTKGVYVVWEDDRDGELQNHNIYFNRSTDGGQSWLEQDVLLELDDEGRSFSQGPQIASAGNDLYVVWYDNLNGASDIMLVASSDNGKTWGEPVRVDSDEPAGAAFSGSPQIAATATGKVYVVWEDTRNGNSDIYFARSENAGSSFRPDTRLDGGDEAGESFSFLPQLSADGDNVYVVWHDARNSNPNNDGGGGRDIFLNYSADGGANWYNTAQRVDSDQAGFFNSLFPKVATIGNRGYVTWYDNRSFDSIYDIWVRTFEAGDPVAPEVRISEPAREEGGRGNSTDVVIAHNGADVLIAWEDERDGPEVNEAGYNDLYYNFIQGGATQAEDLRMDTFYPANSFKTDLNVALHGQLVYAAWTDGREGTSDVFFKKLTLGEAGETLEGEQTSAAAR